MQSLIELYNFLDVVLRAYLLVTQSLIVGGVAFLALVIGSLDATPSGEERLLARRCLRILYWSCVASALGELVAGGVLIAMLVGTLHVDATVAASSNAVAAHFISAGFAGLLALIARLDVDAFAHWRPIALVLALLMVCAHVGVTHVASRPEADKLLVATEIAHIIAAGVWIGGIPYFVVTLATTRDAGSRRSIASKFSIIAICAVAALIAGGVFMMTRYTTSLDTLYETNYGVLMSTKILLLLGLLCFGVANASTVRKLWRVPSTSIRRLSRFAEVEIGLGVIALFCAAALASSSLPIDGGAERTSLSEITARFAPRWPSFYSPAYAELSAAQASEAQASQANSASETAVGLTAADIAWAEMNHHLAGILVVVMGAFALLERHRRLAPIVRHWPLLFLLLGGVLLVRADETAWPLGPLGFFESLRNPQIAQHKLIVALIAIFAIFEWRVRRKLFKSNWPAYVFPLTVGAASAFLLTHYGHTEGADEVLIAISHTPVALLGIVAASARWLEIRSPDAPEGRAGALVWPVAFMLAGVLLLLYREA
jgi:putative copper resistance protein D